jgi:ElaB/YqjD/DUF883 family membrane-anchored ribosome-binding protein
MNTDASFTDSQSSRDKIRSDLRNILSDMDDYLRATANQTGEKIGVLRERLQDQMQRTKVRLADTREVVVDRTKEAARATDEYVHDNPWRAVGVAAGIGLIVGMLIGRR